MAANPDLPLRRFDSAHQIDQLCDEFEQRWKQRGRPRIEDYLQRVPMAQQSELLSELLPLELELMHGASDGDSSLEGYLSRFPEQSDVVKKAFIAMPETIDLNSLAHALCPQTMKDRLGEVLRQIEPLTRVEFYREGDYLIRQGDPADFLIVIQDGSVRITIGCDSDEQQLIDRSHRGEVLGEMALITDEPRTANVIAEGTVVVSKLASDDFRRLVHEQPRFGDVLVGLIAQRLGGQQHDALTDKRLDRYRIVRRLGRGGMAVVYESEDLENENKVALKMMSHALVNCDAALQRFRQEADFIEQFEHPHIVSMERRFEAFHTYFIAMEYCDGTSLDRYLQQHGGMQADQFSLAFQQLASALSYAHGEGVLHRDVKPANVMRLPDGTLKLMDFGLAEPLYDGPTTTGQLIGTPRYMSPEQRRGHSIDERTDLFALGAVAYEMLTGEPLFVGSQDEEIDRDFRFWTPPDFAELAPGLPEAARLNALLEIDPSKRRL